MSLPRRVLTRDPSAVPPIRRRRLRALALAVAGLLSVGAVTASTTGAVAAPGSRSVPVAAAPDLGPNVLVFDPSMPVATIQAAVDKVAAEQVPNQFGTARYALLFKPGTYGTVAQPLVFQVGYYTEVAGLGASPTDEIGRASCRERV